MLGCIEPTVSRKRPDREPRFWFERGSHGCTTHASLDLEFGLGEDDRTAVDVVGEISVTYDDCDLGTDVYSVTLTTTFTGIPEV